MFIKSIVLDYNYIFWHFNVFPIWNTSLPSRRTPFQLTFESLCKIFNRRRQYQICWILIKATHHLLWCPNSSKRISILVYWFFLFFLDLSPWMPFLWFSIKTSSFQKSCLQFYLIIKFHMCVYNPFLYFINRAKGIFLVMDFY